MIIVAGANGSGKTTFATQYVEELGYDFLNADFITKRLEDEGQPQALIKAGRLFFKRLNNYIREEQNFVVETTLSGSYINKVALKAKAANYTVRLIYLFLDNPDMCLERVKLRVKKGGHTVPEEDVIRRFYRSKVNFWQNFRQIADDWLLHYNGEKGLQAVAEGNNQEYIVENGELFNLFLKDIK